MSRPASEIIRVGVSGARIVRVTPELLEYIDMMGQSRYEALPHQRGGKIEKPGTAYSLLSPLL